MLWFVLRPTIGWAPVNGRGSEWVWERTSPQFTLTVGWEDKLQHGFTAYFSFVAWSFWTAFFLSSALEMLFGRMVTEFVWYLKEKTGPTVLLEFISSKTSSSHKLSPSRKSVSESKRRWNRWWASHWRGCELSVLTRYEFVLFPFSKHLQHEPETKAEYFKKVYHCFFFFPLVHFKTL